MQLESVEKLSRDLAAASVTLSDDEARFLVDAYYQMQESRIRAGHQERTLEESGEPHDVLNWLFSQSSTLEAQIQRALDKYSNSSELGQWARGICGIGPVITAGLLAHIDISKAPTVGHIWRYAGLDPTSEWRKGEKRPFNASLKTLCWKIGESFVKVSGNDRDIYGKIYKQRKELETAKNEAGDYSDQAARKLEKFKIGKSTDAYKSYSAGRLPPGHIHARAKRYAVKLFLAHYWEHGYKLLHGKEPPLPYPIQHLGHAHKIEPPVLSHDA